MYVLAAWSSNGFMETATHPRIAPITRSKLITRQVESWLVEDLRKAYQNEIGTEATAHWFNSSTEWEQIGKPNSNISLTIAEGSLWKDEFCRQAAPG